MKKPQSKVGRKAKRDALKPKGVAVNADVFGKLMLMASNRDAALRRLVHRPPSPGEREVARTYWRETSRLRNRTDWALFAQKNLIRDAVAALPTPALKAEAADPKVELPPLPKNLLRPHWRPPANKPASVP